MVLLLLQNIYSSAKWHKKMEAYREGASLMEVKISQGTRKIWKTKTFAY